MELIQWAISPWGKSVPIHIAWGLIWVAVIAGFFFMIVHSLYLIVVKPPKRFAERKAEVSAAAIPERVPRHTLSARLFHWIMAASMITLLITAFLPKVGVQFNWVLYHWIAGVVLTFSILFHIVHSTFFLDFWSIWPDKTDLRDAMNRTRRFFGKDAPLPRQICEVSAGEQAVSRRGDAGRAGGDRYRLVHDEARADGNLHAESISLQRYDMGPDVRAARAGGVGFIALTMVHVYMGVRPEKFPITKSMIFGWMSRDFYLEEHDTGRWAVKGADVP